MTYIFLANGFEEVEAITPYDYIKRSGEMVCFVGVGGKNITGSHGLTVNADVALEDFTSEIEKKDFVVLPGGLQGTKNLNNSEKVLSYIRDAFRVASIGAICAAPSILGGLNLLNGFNACCYPGFEKYLKGATILDEPVVVDRNIITSKGAGTAQEFAFEIIKYICGETKLNEVKNMVQWRR